MIQHYTTATGGERCIRKFCHKLSFWRRIEGGTKEFLIFSFFPYSIPEVLPLFTSKYLLDIR